MKNGIKTTLDLALTEALAKYMDMEATEAFETIRNEWPEQTSVLLAEFLFKTRCPVCGDIRDLIHIARDTSDHTFVAPLCHCENPWPHDQST